MNICSSTHRPHFQRDEVACERESAHSGSHQNLEAGWTWSRGGSHSVNRDAFDCPTCGTRDVQSDLVKERAQGDQCSSCDFWDEAAERYHSGESFAVDGRMYTWNPSHPHGFGGSSVLITKVDGSTIGPGPGLWNNGMIPHERRDVLVDNAIIEWRGRA